MVLEKEASTSNAVSAPLPSKNERQYLLRGLDQPGGKLPLFDLEGQEVPRGLIQSCLDNGWCEPWYRNAIKPDWLVCKLTDKGRSVLL